MTDSSRSVGAAEPPREEPASDPPQPAASGSRAGRNLPAAIAVGLGLGAIVIVTLLLYRPAFVGVVAAAIVASIWELRGTLVKARGIAIAWPPLMVGAVATIALSWPYGFRAAAIGAVVTGFGCLFWRFSRGPAGYLADVSASMLLVIYLIVPAAMVAMMTAPHDGAARVLTLVIVVVCSDTGGYAAGVLAGRHPMAPTISPKKSWEGFGGSLAAAMLGGALCLWLMLHQPWWQGLILGAVLAVTATAGDLAESLIKRDLGVKDMGTLLPGHGGVMDRLDSLLPSAVAAFLLLSVFAPV